MFSFLLLVGCPAPTPEDTDRIDEPDTGAAFVDIDEDGVPADEDCNDYNPENFPGNTEVWDGRDNDCDGRIDGEGTFAGSHGVEATAIYEGEPVEMTLLCSASLLRTPSVLDFEVTCVPDEGDEDAALLLGSVTITPKENGVAGAAWSGAVSLSSSNGWTAEGDGQSTWQSMDRVGLWTRLESVSLQWQGEGSLERTEP